MEGKRFDPKKLDRLNDPNRLLDLPPGVIWKKLHLKGKDVFVDIGAGTGFFSIPFAGYTPTGRVYACDISDTMIQWMQRHIVGRYPNIVPLKMAPDAVPLEDGLADLVYMINLHHELDAPEAMLREARRLLKTDGKLFIADWKKQEMDQGPPIDIRCRPEEVERQLVDAGFAQVAVFLDLPKHFLVTAGKS